MCDTSADLLRIIQFTQECLLYVRIIQRNKAHKRKLQSLINVRLIRVLFIKAFRVDSDTDSQSDTVSAHMNYVRSNKEHGVSLLALLENVQTRWSQYVNHRFIVSCCTYLISQIVAGRPTLFPSVGRRRCTPTIILYLAII